MWTNAPAVHVPTSAITHKVPFGVNVKVDLIWLAKGALVSMVKSVYLLSLIHCIVAAWVVRSKAATACALVLVWCIVCFITHCSKQGSYLCVLSLSNPYANVFSNTPIEHLWCTSPCRLPPVNVWLYIDNMSVANASHSASMTHIHACIILLLILIHSMQHAMLYR